MKKKTEKPYSWSPEELHLLHIVEWQIQHPTANEEQYYDQESWLAVVWSKTQQGQHFWSEAFSQYNSFAYHDFER